MHDVHYNSVNVWTLGGFGLEVRNRLRSISRNEDNLSKIDAKFKYLGRIFIVGSVTGVIRAIVNAVQIPFALIGALIFQIGDHGFRALSHNRQSGWLRYKEKCLEYTNDKLLNVGRGIVEAIPFAGLLLASYDVNEDRRKFHRGTS